jgi:ankyrin repeat protein
VDKVAELLRSGCDPEARDARGRTALMYAAGARNAHALEKVAALLHAGASADAQDDEGLTAAAFATRAFNVLACERLKRVMKSPPPT